MYIRSSRELKRLESISKSPIYAQFTETLGGLSVIRAFRKQEAFVVENERKLDLNQRVCILLSTSYILYYFILLLL